MLLYNSEVSGNCYKVRLLLAQVGIADERREVDVVDRTATSPTSRWSGSGFERVAAQPGHVPIEA
jgi:hypothetical protein